jgi:rhamnosyltransferase subunit B
MKVIIYALGTSGDINPMVGIGKLMKDRGYSVILLTSNYFKELIEASGFEFVSVGTEEEYLRGNQPSAWEVKNAADNFIYYHAPAFLPAYQYIEQLQQKENVVLLSIGEQNGAVTAAIKHGIPYIKFAVSPNLIFSAEKPPAPLCWQLPKKIPKFIQRIIVKYVDKKSMKLFFQHPEAKPYVELRKKLGCPVTYDRKSNAELLIGLFPEWFGMRAKDWPKDMKLVGFPLSDPANKDARLVFDSILEEIGSPIVFTTGTGVSEAEDVFKEGRKICELLNLPGLFVGSNGSKSVLSDSALCRHIDYIDFEYALPKCRAIVHHGGIGTLSQAVRAGIPQLIRPIKYDQPDNANRLHQLGLGTFVFPNHFKAEAVAPILKAMIDAASQNKALAIYSTDIKRSNAIEKACDLIEKKIKELELP